MNFKAQKYTFTNQYLVTTQGRIHKLSSPQD